MGEEIWMILELFRSGPSKQVHKRLALTAEEIRHTNQGPRHLRGFSDGGISGDMLHLRLRVRSGGLPPTS